MRNLCCLVIALAATTAFARPEHKQSLKRYYGEAIPAAMAACSTCHIVPEGVSEAKLAEDAPPHNAFGTRLRELGEQLEADGKAFDLISRLKIVAGEDADGDNVANELEGYNQERAKRNVDMVRHILGRVFDVADAEDIPTFQAANRVAERRIESMSDLKDFWLNPDLPRRIEARAQNRP